MRKLALRGLVLTVVIGLLGLGSYAIAGGGSKNFKGKDMNGYEENLDVSTRGDRLVRSRALGRRRPSSRTSSATRGSRGPSTQATSTSGRPRSTAASRSGCARPRRTGPESAGRHARRARSPARSTGEIDIGRRDRAGRAGHRSRASSPRSSRRCGPGMPTRTSTRPSRPGGEIRAQINDNKRGND